MSLFFYFECRTCGAKCIGMSIDPDHVQLEFCSETCAEVWLERNRCRFCDDLGQQLGNVPCTNCTKEERDSKYRVLKAISRRAA